MTENTEKTKEIIARLERIERAILGDSEHEVWGYKHKWRDLNKRVTDLETTMIKRTTDINGRLNEITDEMAKAEGFKAAIIVIATLFGGAIGTVLTIIFGGS